MLTQFRDDPGLSCPQKFSNTLGLALIFSGCRRAKLTSGACPGCFSTSFWNFLDPEVGQKALEELSAWLKKITRNGRRFSDLYSYVTFTGGGEPLDQTLKHLSEVASVIRSAAPSIPIIIYSGYDELNSIPRSSLLFVGETANYLKLGSYIQDLLVTKGKTKHALPTSNQFFLKLVRTKTEVNYVRI